MALNPLLTNVGPNTPLYAPASAGGGGGGGGDNQSISSITTSSILFNVAGGDGTTPYALNILGQGAPSQVIFDNGGISAPAPASVYTGMWASTLVNHLSLSQAGCFFVTQDPGFANSQLVMGSIISSDGNIIASTDQNRNTAPLNIIANPLAVSSLVVSSINGATPGGGGGGASGGIAVSSITTFPGQANPSTILMAPGAAGNVAISGFPASANATGDFVFDTVISANAINTAFQPGGNANALLMFSPTNTGVNLNMGATDVGGAVIAVSDSTSGNPSTLTVASDTIKVVQPVAGGSLNIYGDDTNLYALAVPAAGGAAVKIGTVAGRNQVYMQPNARVTGDLAVSSINGLPPGGVSGLTNYLVPFENGSVIGGLYQVNVDSNTSGIPIAITSTLVTNSSHTYEVSYNLASGSNTDTSAYTQISLQASGAGGNPIMQSSPGFSNFWIFNGNVGARSMLISGASALKLLAGTNSATTSTILYLDTVAGFRVTDLGP